MYGVRVGMCCFGVARVGSVAPDKVVDEVLV